MGLHRKMDGAECEGALTAFSGFGLLGRDINALKRMLLPMPFFKYSWIFKSRWLALLWVAGICYEASEFVGEAPAADASNAAALTDEASSTVRPEDVKQLEDTLNSIAN